VNSMRTRWDGLEGASYNNNNNKQENTSKGELGRIGGVWWQL
jgi:hypothetical protein